MGMGGTRIGGIPEGGVRVMAIGGVTMAEAAEAMRRAFGSEPDPLDPIEEMRDWDRRFAAHVKATVRMRPDGPVTLEDESTPWNPEFAAMSIAEMKRAMARSVQRGLVIDADQEPTAGTSP